MNQPTMDAALGLKVIGQAQVEKHSGGWVGMMRDRARRLAQLNGNVTSDDLRAHADAMGLQPHDPHAWGAIFRTGFIAVDRVRSKVASNHGRWITVWVEE